MEAAAVKAIQAAEATIAVNKAIDDAFAITLPVVAHPADFKLASLEGYYTTRLRMRGSMKTANLVGFVEYIKLFNQTGVVFLSEKSMNATAVMNFGDTSDPGHCDNTATFSPEPTSAYREMTTILQNEAVSQQTLAHFLEDWMDDVACTRDGNEIALGLAIAAIRNLTIDQIKTATSTEEKLSASVSTFESISADKNANLPTEIVLRFRPYRELEHRTFRLRVGISVSGDKTRITIKLRNAEQHGEQMLQEMLASIIDALTDIDVGIFLGEFNSRA